MEYSDITAVLIGHDRLRLGKLRARVAEVDDMRRQRLFKGEAAVISLRCFSARVNTLPANVLNRSDEHEADYLLQPLDTSTPYTK